MVAGLAVGGGMLAREGSEQAAARLPSAGATGGSTERPGSPGAPVAAGGQAAKQARTGNGEVASQVSAPVPAVSPPAASPSASPPEPPAPASVKDDSGAAESGHTDAKAAEYFDKRWGKGDKAAKRLKDIRTVGGYLRIYTDLPESADNSKQAITLCERGLEYLKEMGEERPVVFVQAEFGENGNPVLANVLGPDDGDCRVTHPATD
ncbi:hypothetical protein [Nonomuraea recticatena]|uniref:Uncharacterized protein n=1 Tax=Nonomuraea recticatena TaxID=46178 RepID=A0ABN3SHA0_9ACTN